MPVPGSRSRVLALGRKVRTHPCRKAWSIVAGNARREQSKRCEQRRRSLKRLGILRDKLHGNMKVQRQNPYVCARPCLSRVKPVCRSAARGRRQRRSQINDSHAARQQNSAYRYKHMKTSALKAEVFYCVEITQIKLSADYQL